MSLYDFAALFLSCLGWFSNNHDSTIEIMLMLALYFLDSIFEFFFRLSSL